MKATASFSPDKNEILEIRRLSQYRPEDNDGCTFMLLLVLFAFTFLVGLGAAVAFADELNIGRSPLFLKNDTWKYGKYKDGTTGIGNYRVAFLWETAGTSNKNSEAELARPEVNGVELILFNATCVRGGTCAPYETFAGYSVASLNAALKAGEPKLMAKIGGRASDAATWLKAHLRPGQRCWWNFALEHQMPRDVFEKAAGTVAPLFAGWCDGVWNPVGGSPGKPQAPAVVSEGHGDAPEFPAGVRCIANPDGTAVKPADYPGYLVKYGQRCEAAFAWDANGGDNCRAFGSPATDPRKRKCNIVKGFKELKGYLQAARKAAAEIPAWSDKDNESLKGCKVMIPSTDGNKKGFLWKQSEPPCCGRGAVTFLPERFRKPEIKPGAVKVYKHGKVIGTSYERGVYHEDHSNRQFYRFRRLATDFPYNIVVHFGEICAKVINPKIRND